MKAILRVYKENMKRCGSSMFGNLYMLDMVCDSPLHIHSTNQMNFANAISHELFQLGLRETVSKGRDRCRYIPVGLSRPSDWLSQPLYPSIVNWAIGTWAGGSKTRSGSSIDLISISKYGSSQPPSGALQCEGVP
ncbi:hypothetical protein OUZ56_018676 [Daphnia magna]|uniref:Uncharacterized protein n=1 Tax=Daphnia magna TaxID=35525 RepID=A0ABQ9Z9I5_9CRUS|nr:hypothetical protein OUZ56_018676 [Daphnia magna]